MKLIGTAFPRIPEHNRGELFDDRLMQFGDNPFAVHLEQYEEGEWYPGVKGFRITLWDFGPNVIAECRAKTIEQCIAMMKGHSSCD